ncbi:MAG: four helix bundle protein [Clostridia bacterium]|nr:four helix bundle protein [Clostridia bacterium]
MKSLRDEIRTNVRDKEYGFDFIVSEANDFIRASRGFHRGSDAISLKTRDFIIAENKLADLSTEFAVQILKLSDSMKGHYSLANQLERSGTSIGANIREAKYAHGKADFIAKLQIALKECYETEYWIEIAQKANIVSEESVKTLLHDCGAIRRMLISSINTSKENSRG